MQGLPVKRAAVVALAALALGFLAWGVGFSWRNLRGVAPAVLPPPRDIAEAIKETGMPLTLPAGFSISVFAKDLPGARVMAFDEFGNLWVSQTSEGVVSMLELQGGQVIRQQAVFRDLQRPHGLAFNPQSPGELYIAEEDKVSRVTLYSENSSPHQIAALPRGGGHFTRTIGFGPDGRLYISVGSSCNVCREADPRRATVFSMAPDGNDVREFASGLRNAVFFTWDAGGRMWATEMGRDLLGDDVPPDEINVLETGRNYGWPLCFGKNVHDDDFDDSVYKQNPCDNRLAAPSSIDVPAHSAPLGLAFVPDGGWPAGYQGNLLVAYHGSWNRSVPTGYKVVRYRLDANGNYLGVEDFITGWLTEDGRALGRPVDIVFGPDGAAYLSDDKAGVVYRVAYIGSQAPPGGGKPPPTVGSGEPCKVTGCSGQACSDRKVVTTCEYLPEYACYQGARCERQPNGRCGWTETEALQACVAAARSGLEPEPTPQ